MGEKSYVPAQAPAPQQDVSEGPAPSGPDNSGVLAALGVVSFTGGGGYVWRRGQDGSWICSGGPRPEAIGKKFKPGDPVYAKIDAEYQASGGAEGGTGASTTTATKADAPASNSGASSSDGSWWDAFWDGLGDLWDTGKELAEDASERVSDFLDGVGSWWNKDEEEGADGGGGGAGEEPVTEAKDEYAIVTDANALLREGPPDYKSKGTKVDKDTEVHVLELAYKPGQYNGYARIEPRAGGAELGWTAAANLTSSKDMDPAWKPAEALDLKDLSGDELTMARLYNEKGAFIKSQAERLGITASVAAGTLIAESGGRGYAADGRPIIRFENHQFYNRWGKNNQETYDKHFSHRTTPNAEGKVERWKDHRFRASEEDEWGDVHANQGREWEVLEFAMDLGSGSEEPAAQSISIGAGQVMGFNFAMFGYESAVDMLEKMTNDPTANVGGVFNFIEANATAKKAIQDGDYVAFASAYNGPGKAAEYGGIIERLSEAWDSVMEKKGVAE